MTSLAESPPARSGSRSSDRAQALRRQIDDRLGMLAKALDEVRASEMFRQYLDVQARFHKYSWHNTMLIVTQKPDAERVAGFKTWQTMGRHVRKGERGIMIFAPRPWKHTETDEDGIDTERQGVSFRPVHVFDVSQTDGEPLPEVEVPDVETAADTLLASLERVAAKRDIVLHYTELEAGHFGVSKGGEIDIATGHTTGQQAKTLAHELAHEAMHKRNRPDGLTRTVAELEAESVAYAVCTHFRMDVTVRASRYIAIWDGDAKALRESLERIATTARDIIDDVDTVANGKAVA
ncbi:MAG: ArdC-like ssDNA-binding domain-containing protein [Planctomycetota bacterium]|nr:ArdC-like ssDNA-binding domain-containing protein [Planctomycetota bacterium]